MAKIPKLPVLSHPAFSNGFVLEKGHQPVVFVPTLRGARCTTCRWVSDDLKRCVHPAYRAWMGTDRLPGPAWEVCSDWWEAVEEVEEDDGLEDL